MTLLVAGIVGNTAWMVADTAITRRTSSVREREYQIKIEPLQTKALIGFAGDQDNAVKIVRAATEKIIGMDTVQFLLSQHRQHFFKDTAADFMYAYFDDAGPHLYCITEQGASARVAAHIGQREAFALFQNAKQYLNSEYSPDTIVTFISSVDQDHGEAPLPADAHTAVEEAVRSLQAVFYKTNGREIGGIAIPYVLLTTGARLFNYVYSATDPVVSQLAPGAVIPHGTAPSGGFGISVSALDERDGIVIYWLQKPGGEVWLRTSTWFEKHEFSGSPSEFINAVKIALGRIVHVWFGEQMLGPPESLKLIRDPLGRPIATVVHSGQSISFGWVPASEPFFGSADFSPTENLMAALNTAASHPLTAKLSDDEHSASISINGDSGDTSISVTADKLDDIIRQLSALRSRMTPLVAPDLETGTQLVAVINPAWRARKNLHALLPGASLWLRHPGLGWLAFQLPPNEMNSLGKWLFENSQD